jgi:hypothetical protein
LLIWFAILDDKRERSRKLWSPSFFIIWRGKLFCSVGCSIIFSTLFKHFEKLFWTLNFLFEFTSCSCFDFSNFFYLFLLF